MTTDKRIEDMAADVAYIRARLDQHIQSAGADRVQIEQRLTSVEVRSGFWGLIGGLLSGAGIHWSKTP